MRLPHSAASTQRAFTLIELLVVISIIAVLMGLLFPVANMMKENGRKVTARSDVMATINATKYYFTEYGKYPELQIPAIATEDAYAGDPATALTTPINNSALYDSLRAIGLRINVDHILNPKRVIFLEAKSVAKVTAPRGGFLDKAGAAGGDSTLEGCWFDPWGKQYNIGIDRNYDNQVDMSKIYKDITLIDSPRTGVTAFALGSDNAVGDKKTAGKLAGSDDVASWQ